MSPQSATMVYNDQHAARYHFATTYRTGNLPIDDHDRPRKAIRRHGLIRDVKMVLQKSTSILSIIEITYLDHFTSVRPMQIHICIDINLAMPASSRLWAMIASAIRRILSVLSSRRVIPQSMLFPRYFWCQYLCGRYTEWCNERAQNCRQSGHSRNE